MCVVLSVWPLNRHPALGLVSYVPSINKGGGATPPPPLLIQRHKQAGAGRSGGGETTQPPSEHLQVGTLQGTIARSLPARRLPAAALNPRRR